MTSPVIQPPIYGLIAEFDTPTEIVVAARKAHAEGYRRMDAYSPFPVEGLAEAVGFPRNRVATVTLVGALCGTSTAYLLQYWINWIAYPLNIAGRPFHSWPAFIIVTFELTILFGGLSAAIGMLVMNGLPLPYHPLFNVPSFAGVTRDKFFLCIEASDPRFERQSTYSFLSSLEPKAITEVPH
jgi:hypothetical protein